MASMICHAVCLLVFAVSRAGLAEEALSFVAPLKEEFDRDVAALAEERKFARAPIVKEYVAALEKLASELTAEGRPVMATAARVEKARVEAGGEIKEEDASSAPFEVLSIRAAHLEKLRAKSRELDARIAERATRYLGALENAATDVPAEESAKARLRVQAERDQLRKEGLIAQRNIKRTRAAGGGGGGRFEEMGEDGAVLVGLILRTGDFAGHHVLVGAQPIFGTKEATRLGMRRGKQHGAAVKLEAKEGYAVGGLNLHAGDRVDGLEIVFMKLKPDRLTLDPEDFYKSEWVGGRGGGGWQLRGSGNVLIGIHGATGLEFDSLGLIELLPTPVADGKPKAAAVKEVNRENPATVAVMGLTAQSLVEAPTREAGKWQRVPEQLRGAKIHDVTPNKHLGISEYQVTSPGRAYLALNFEYQGNPSGGWTVGRWLEKDFRENGWSRVEGLDLRSWEGRTFLIFTRELSLGESGRLRCNKYEPPYFISFNP